MKPVIFLLACSLLFVNSVALPCKGLDIYDCLDEFLVNWLNSTITLTENKSLNNTDLQTADRSPQSVKKTEVVVDRLYLTDRSRTTSYRYRINKGDTLWDIAKRYNTTVSNIQSYNPNISARNLIVGSYIYIPTTKTLSLTFNWPLSGTITSPFGMRNSKLHKGLDIAAITGTKIKSAASGVVVESGWHSSYGFYVLVNHINGYQTRYAHCSKLLVKKGQQINSQQTIALVGSTGKSTGPHVHFEIIKDKVHQNPMKYLP